MHVHQTDLPCGVELDGLPDEPFEVITVVHKIAASLFEVELNLRVDQELAIPSADEDLMRAFPHYLNGEDGVYLIYVHLGLEKGLLKLLLLI